MTRTKVEVVQVSFHRITSKFLIFSSNKYIVETKESVTNDSSLTVYDYLLEIPPLLDVQRPGEG
jgi:hypothetical protein